MLGFVLSVENGDVKMEKTEKIDEFIKQEKGRDFIHICNNPLFFERECNMRHYAICVSCGFIPLSMIDRDTKFLDLHCKCGKFAIYSSFPEEEILVIIHNTRESMKFESV